MQTYLEAYGFKRLSCGGMPGSALAGRNIKVPELFSRVRPFDLSRSSSGQSSSREELVPDFSEDRYLEGLSPEPAPSQIQGVPEGGPCSAGAAQRW